MECYLFFFFFQAHFGEQNNKSYQKPKNTIEHIRSEADTRHKHQAFDGNDDFGEIKIYRTECCLCVLRVLSVKMYVLSVNASNLIVFSWMSKSVRRRRCRCRFQCHWQTNRPTEPFIPFSCCGFGCMGARECVCVCVWTCGHLCDEKIPNPVIAKSVHVVQKVEYELWPSLIPTI